MWKGSLQCLVNEEKAWEALMPSISVEAGEKGVSGGTYKGGIDKLECGKAAGVTSGMTSDMVKYDGDALA